MSEHDSHAHTSFIQTPKQLLVVVVLAFIVPVIVIAMIASLAFRSVNPSASAFSEDAIAKRIRAREAGGNPRTAWRIAAYAEDQVTSVIAMARTRGALDRDPDRGAPVVVASEFTASRGSLLTAVGDLHHLLFLPVVAREHRHRVGVAVDDVRDLACRRFLA